MPNSNGNGPVEWAKQEQTQEPLQEALEQATEATNLYLAPRLVAVEDYRAAAAGYRARVHDAHRIGMKLLGIPDEYISPNPEDKMGDLVLQRDHITNQNFPQAPAPTATVTGPAPAPAPTPTTTAPAATATPPKKNSWLVPALAAAGIGLGALGTGFGIASLMDDDKPSVVVQPGQPGQPVIVNPNQPNPDRDWKASAYVTRPGNK